MTLILQGSFLTLKSITTHYFFHLGLEKILKAIYISRKKEPALPIHDFIRLSQGAAIVIDPEITLQLAEISTVNIAARYDDYKFKFYKKATQDYAQ